MKDLIFEIIGVDRASKTFEKVGGEITENTTKLSAMGKAGAIAGKALVVGLAGVAAAGYESVKAATEEQTAQAQLAKQLHNATGATKEQIAASNEWIEKQAEAKGIAVDQLDPALAKLATSTGSISKAQQELSTAMDVSAGSGKSLDSVATALVRVNNGQVTGLSKLGVQTKVQTQNTAALKYMQTSAKMAQQAYTKAVAEHGKTSTEAQLAQEKFTLANQKVTTAQKNGTTTTLSATQAMDALSKKYQGDASKAADTVAGKQKVLGVEIHDLEVKIGTGLLPVVEKLTDDGLKMVDWASKNGSTVEVLAVAIGSLLVVTWAVSKAMAAWTAVSKIAAAATRIFAADQVELDAAMDANPIGLVVIAIAALVTGLILAYQHSSKFRAVVQDTFGFLKKYVPPIISFVVDFVKDHWLLLGTLIGGPLVLVVAEVVKHFTAIKAFVSAAISDVVADAKGVGRFATAVGQHVADAAAFFKALPGKVTGFLAGLPGQMLTIGGNIVQGLVHGIENAAGAVMNAVQSLVNKIPKKIRQIMGIASPSKVTAGLGDDIASGLAVGMDRSSSKAESAAKKLADKIKAQLSTLRDNYSSTQSGVAGAFTGDLFSATATDAVTDADGNVTAPAQTAGQNWLTGLTSTQGTLSQLIPAFKQLEKWGWKPGVLSQLFQSGNGSLILELASNKAEAEQGMGLIGQIGSLSNKLGGQVAQNQYGDQIDTDEAKLHGKGKKGKGGTDAREATGDTINVTINGALDGNDAAKKVVQAIKKYKREVNGGGELGIA